jgi:hypothetical protein
MPLNMKVLLRLILCLAICVGIVFEADAQSIRVAGKVTTSNGTGIAGVHVFDSIANIGTTSDINGIFSLTIPPKANFPSSGGVRGGLRFSHIAFNTQYLSLTQKKLADTIAANTIWLEVVLTQKVMELATVEISDAKVQIAYKNPKQWILDYEPVGTDEFLLLLLEKNKKYLQLINSDHEKISQMVVDKDYDELFKSYLETFHVLSKDSACQVFLVDEELQFLYHYTRLDFDKMMAHIVVDTDNYLYTKNYSRHNQFVLYKKFNKESKKVTPFVENFNKEQAIFADHQLSMLASAPLSSGRKLGEIQFYKYVLAIPPYSLLAKIKDTLYFFDHLNSKISIYSLDGNYIKETPISYHNNKDWDKEIIVNEEKTRCFAKFTRNGETSLVEINPNTGQMMGKHVLEVHAFPTKIRVRGNEIYYMSKDYFEGEQKYFLWKQKME